MWWKIARLLALILLLVTGSIGVYNGISEWGEGRTPLQHSVTVSVLIYGVFGLVSAYGLLRRQPWSVPTAVLWMLGVVYAPGVAVMAYGGEDAIIGSAIAASVGSALVALGVVWTIQVTMRDLQRKPPK